MNAAADPPDAEPGQGERESERESESEAPHS
jgi:hypothetical protein